MIELPPPPSPECEKPDHVWTFAGADQLDDREVIILACVRCGRERLI